MTWHAGLRTEVERMFHALSVPDIWSVPIVTTDTGRAPDARKPEERRAYWRAYRRERRRAENGQRREQRLALTARILELRSRGMTFARIAAEVGRSPKLVTKTIRNPQTGLWARGQR